MPYSLPAEELKHLRELAKRQAEIAALPVMAARRKLWTDVNDNVPGARPPFVINPGTFWRDFMEGAEFRIKDGIGRKLESMFLFNIRTHEILGDDHVCPDSIPVGWLINHDEFGIDIKTEHAVDADGNSLGYHVECPLKDLSGGFEHIIKPASFAVDKAGTKEHRAFLEECFGDILPVVMRGPSILGCLTQRLLRLMTMETFYTEVYDHPETLHALMALLRDNARRHILWCQEEGLLTLNNGNQTTSGSYANFTTRLPKTENEKVFATDLWGQIDSQETVGISPEMFHEFCFPYYRDVAELTGLLYWGCCEPMAPLWEKSLSHLPNLAAISISRWENQNEIAEMLDGRGVVFARKPNPNFLGVGKNLDEDGWAAEIRSTLEAVAGKNIPLAFDVRCVNSLNGNLPKTRRAVEIANREIDKFHMKCKH